MGKILRALLIAALATWGIAYAHARTGVPIINHENVSIVTSSGKQPSDADVAQAIRQAAASVHWEIADNGPGKMTATLMVRGKHTMRTEIQYSPQNFSVRYLDSTNMNYEPASPSGALIHPNYNKWVQSLVDSIRARVSSL